VIAIRPKTDTAPGQTTKPNSGPTTKVGPGTSQPVVRRDALPDGKRTEKPSHGDTRAIDQSGNVRSFAFKSPKGYDTTVRRDPRGTQTIVSGHDRAPGEHITLVNTGRNRGYVDHTIVRNGNPYLRRTNVVNGYASVVMYRGYRSGGRVYYGYLPHNYYAPAFYRWAYNPSWAAQVRWGWGWGTAPWYGYYGYYFAPYPFYAGPAFWLTDYIISENLQAAYEAAGNTSTPENSDRPSSQADGNASQAVVTVPGNQAWTPTGTLVNAGDEVTITATGGVAMSSGSAPMSPAGDPRSCLIAANGPYGWRASPFPDVNLPCWSLIGKIGENGRAFFVGANRGLRATSSGQLYLGVNDNALGDNSGNWVATINVPSSAPTGGSPSSSGSDVNQNTAELTPAVKAAIADEVKAQLAAEQTASVTTTDAASAGDQVPAALDPKQRTFIVSTAIAAQTTGGAQCSLSPGDILTRVTDTPDSNQEVTALVTSSQKNDCASGSMLRVSVEELQDMHNDFAQKIDSGLQKLADNQGKNGMPVGPSAAPRLNPDEQAVPDPTAVTDLQQQVQAADGAEKDLNQAAISVGAQNTPGNSLADQLRIQYKFARIANGVSGPVVLQAGTVLVIQNAGLVGTPLTSLVTCASKFQDGNLKVPSPWCVGMVRNIARDLSAGEKVYVTKIEVVAKDDKVLVQIVECDSCNGVSAPSSYKSEIAFQFPKGYLVAADAGQIEDVINQALQADAGSASDSQTQNPLNRQQGRAQTQAVEESDVPPRSPPAIQAAPVPEQASETPRTVQRGIHSVNFRNFEYHSDALDETVRVKDGEWFGATVGETSGNYFKVAKIAYGDLKSDGQEEAVVWTEAAFGGMSPNTHQAEIFVFAMSSSGPRLLASLARPAAGRGDEVDWGRLSDVGVNNRQLNITFEGGECNACTDWVANASFAWNGSRFVRTSLNRKRYVGQQ
jgi:hypothetical protein